MRLWKSVRRHWFSVMLYTAFSVFFLAASLLSAATYVHVVDAHERIHLEEASHSASILPNGTLLITFSIEIANPTRYDVSLYTVSWEAVVFNGTSGPTWIIPVASEYRGSSESPLVPAGSDMAFSYSSHVTDPLTLHRLKGYINYTVSQGGSVTLETLPYVHGFTAYGWLGDFEHEYLREFYLNDLARITLDYDSRWYA
ncbi:MAG: hypothetical protein JW880_08575 [Candidatus Thermoplasmatota archaeon]|nr:hypothetical protein [Candidatus Thermoplasmatota archaeon]